MRDVEFAYVSTGHACRAIDCRKAALYRWGAAGLIDYFRTPGGDYRWDIAGFVARQKAAGARDLDGVREAA